MKFRLFTLPLIAVLTACSSAKRTESSFENGTIDPIWSKSKLAPGSYEIVSKNAKAGTKSIKLTLKKGMLEQVGSDGKVTERAELKERHKHCANLGETHLYKFSFFLPTDFPVIDTRLVIGQWKQDGSNNPVVSQRLSKGRFQIVLSNRFGKKVIFELSREETKTLFGRWVDVSYKIKFDKLGSINYTFADHEGSYNGEVYYPTDKPNFYFKFGLYRDQVTPSMSVFFDDYTHTKI